MDRFLTIRRRETDQLHPPDFLCRFPGRIIQYLDDSSVRDPRKAESTEEFSAERIARRQREGCGVYFTPNAFSGRRRIAELLAIQAVYLDIDAAKERDGQDIVTIERTKEDSLLTLLSSALPPHAVTETKKRAAADLAAPSGRRRRRNARTTGPGRPRAGRTPVRPAPRRAERRAS